MAVKEKIGVVVSDKMMNTRIVAVNDRIIHKKYKKVITRTKRYVVQDSTFNSSIIFFIKNVVITKIIVHTFIKS